MINLFIFTFMYIYIQITISITTRISIIIIRIIMIVITITIIVIYIHTIYTHTPYFKTILRHMTYPHPKDQSDHGKSCFSFSFWQLLEPWGRWRWPPSGSVDPNNGLVPGRSLKPYVFSWLFMLLFPMCFPCFFLCFSMVSPV